MRKALAFGSLLLALSACATTTERTLPPPLPDKVTAMPYTQLLERARSQAARATEVSYDDNWSALAEAARGLEQTAKFMQKATDLPQANRDTFVLAAGDLGKLARDLSTTAAAQEREKSNELLTKINRKVREMKPGS